MSGFATKSVHLLSTYSTVTTLGCYHLMVHGFIIGASLSERAYGKAGNGSGMETGNGKWKWKLEMEI